MSSESSPKFISSFSPHFYQVSSIFPINSASRSLMSPWLNRSRRSSGHGGTDCVTLPIVPVDDSENLVCRNRTVPSSIPVSPVDDIVESPVKPQAETSQRARGDRINVVHASVGVAQTYSDESIQAVRRSYNVQDLRASDFVYIIPTRTST
ncbi:hypothetical protein BDV98DRAFT_226082 [Pterulicium gracile]|uniref:Uncharacterized protein n=1 Tax=Pterulicium gracile TaxID=1884261 RepID=A0A5C3QW83_9AGAR|nr:hypothetical protein BDV98DRAFT_226082 [Pterula gracilis]